MSGDRDRDDDAEVDRRAILARRAVMIAGALAGLGLAVAGPTSVGIGPVAHAQGRDAGASRADGASGAGDAAPGETHAAGAGESLLPDAAGLPTETIVIDTRLHEAPPLPCLSPPRPLRACGCD